MIATLLRKADQPSMAWKNGGGQTRQLLCWPLQAAASDYCWRLSVARIDRDGPFSAFPGYQRCLILLDGAGLQLSFASGDVRVDAIHPRIDFAGELAPGCRLLDGPTSDFNLIIRTGEQCSVDAIELHGDWSASVESGQLLALYLCSGKASCADGELNAGDLYFGSALRLNGSAKALVLRLPA